MPNHGTPTPIHQYPKNRIAFSARMRDWVWRMTNGRCYYCGVQTLPFSTFTIDHKRPLARGGDHHIMNLVPACKSCNSSKGARLLIDEWLPAGEPFFCTDEYSRSPLMEEVWNESYECGEGW